jgi:C4-dicarboxylate-binding protein DctP
VVVNKKFWDGLPPDIRAILDGAMKEATKFANDNAQADNDAALRKIAESGRLQILQLTPPELAEWKKAMVRSHAQMEERIGRDLIQEIYRETGFRPD